MRYPVLLIILLFQTSVFSMPWYAKGLRLELKSKTSLRKSSVDLYIKSAQHHDSTIIVSPGGKISAKNMRGLATHLAGKGHHVYVLEYPAKLPLSDGDLAKNLAKTLTLEASSVPGFPYELLPALRGQKPIYLLGHSLGAAVMGDDLEERYSYFDGAILVGADNLIKTPKEVHRHVALVRGELDGLVNQSMFQKLTEQLGNPITQTLPGVNHFCIISDMGAGDPRFRARDNPSPLTNEQCIQRVSEASDQIIRFFNRSGPTLSRSEVWDDQILCKSLARQTLDSYGLQDFIVEQKPFRRLALFAFSKPKFQTLPNKVYQITSYRDPKGNSHACKFKSGEYISETLRLEFRNESCVDMIKPAIQRLLDENQPTNTPIPSLAIKEENVGSGPAFLTTPVSYSLEDNKLEIKLVRLLSALEGDPRYAGMNYCKFPSLYKIKSLLTSHENRSISRH